MGMGTSSVGRLLRAYRKRHGLSQADLAEILGEQQSTIARIETGRREVTARAALRWPQLIDIGTPYDLRPQDIINRQNCQNCQIQKKPGSVGR